MKDFQEARPRKSENSPENLEDNITLGTLDTGSQTGRSQFYFGGGSKK